VQYWLATNHLWTLGATVASLSGLLAAVGLLQWRKKAKGEKTAAVGGLSFGWVAFPYILLIGLAACVFMIPSVNEFVNRISLSLPIPEVRTAMGVVTAAEDTRGISVFGHPGAILGVSSIISMLVYARLGIYKPGYLSRIWGSVSKGAVTSSLGILCMVSLATVMSHSGMTQILALGLSNNIAAAYYPLVAPFIGMIGAFITGSNNNANVLFAGLQMQTATLLKIPVTLILGSQTAGGSLGSMFAPAKVIVGCSTAGLSGQEGKVMGKTILYGIIPVIVVAVFGYIWLRLRGSM
jgi:lactate permease